jgi:hypothetical protein
VEKLQELRRRPSERSSAAAASQRRCGKGAGALPPVAFLWLRGEGSRVVGGTGDGRWRRREKRAEREEKREERWG